VNSQSSGKGPEGPSLLGSTDSLKQDKTKPIHKRYISDFTKKSKEQRKAHNGVVRNAKHGAADYHGLDCIEV